jgi:membrane-associated protease RseP (regulator of RpoE activity)
VVDFQNSPPPVAKGQLAAWGKAGKQIGNSYRFPDGQLLTPPHNYRGTCTDCHPQFLTPGFDPNNYGMGRGSVLPATPGQGPNQVWGQRRYLGPGLGRGQGPYPGAGLRRNPGPWCPVAGPNSISLGMTVCDVDDVISNQNNMMRPGGVFVISLMPGMPAEAAGLQRGDVIVRVDGRKIQDSASFEKILETKGGSSMDLVILRFGVRKTVKVTITKSGAAQAMAGTTPIKQPTSFAWLGADLKALPPDKAGVSVVEVEGVLGVAGVKAGDIITGVNNSKITDMNSFIEMTTKVKIKKGILIDVIRSGMPLYITVKG